jgi:hypothetical protein
VFRDYRGVAAVEQIIKPGIPCSQETQARPPPLAPPRRIDARYGKPLFAFFWIRAQKVSGTSLKSSVLLSISQSPCYMIGKNRFEMDGYDGRAIFLTDEVR